MGVNTKLLELVETLSIDELQIVAIVGAGISKASGMPTFRGEDGMWNSFKAEELATPQAFSQNPILVWDWYRARMKILKEAKPNAAHYALTKLEEKKLLMGVITQNVDGLHELAKTKNIIEIHGRIRYARCTKCDNIIRWDETTLIDQKGDVPRCSSCSNFLRPDVVWFGESLDLDKLEKTTQLLKEAKIVLIIGTSGVVYPVASFPLQAKSRGATLIEFNIEETPLTRFCDYSIIGPSEETLPYFTEKIIEKGEEI